MTSSSTYPIYSVLHEDGTVEKEREPQLADEELLNLYRNMVRVRALNQRGMHLQRQGRIAFYIGVEGQEAVHMGSAAALKDADWYFPHYRDLGVVLLRGEPIAPLVHQLYGTAKDPIKGRQMPNHYSSWDKKFFSISSPLTTQLPHAVGAAYAAKVKGDDVVTMTGFGDGSTSEGDFHVAMNFAGVWKTPTVFICNNNQWAISVPVEKQTASETFSQKAVAYGFNGVRVDGNDVLAMYAVSKDAVEKARRGEGPTLIEAVTFRMGPHSSSDDPTRYVPEEQKSEWAKKDPIERFRKYLVNRGLWDDAKEEAFQSEVKEEIQTAVKEAEATDPPSIRSMFEDVYEEMPWHLEEQCKELQEFEEEGS